VKRIREAIYREVFKNFRWMPNATEKRMWLHGQKIGSKMSGRFQLCGGEASHPGPAIVLFARREQDEPVRFQTQEGSVDWKLYTKRKPGA
jgi:hypothetical protein